LSVFKRK